MLISVHLPKTAGMSFGHSLQNYFGKYFLRDYSDLPINTPVFERNLRAIEDSVNNSVKKFKKVKCIHGHFLPLKYLHIGVREEVKFITWLRNPVERLASNYYFWLRAYNSKTTAPLHKRVVEENWSLERFCLSPELRNFYTQFFWGFPISRFDFIGVTEYYKEDFKLFSEKILGARLSLYIENTNDDVKEGRLYITDSSFRQEVEAYHDLDMALYRRVLETRLRDRSA